MKKIVFVVLICIAVAQAGYELPTVDGLKCSRDGFGAASRQFRLDDLWKIFNLASDKLIDNYIACQNEASEPAIYL